MNDARRRSAGPSSFAIAVTLTVGGILGTLTLLPPNVRAATLYVGGGGPGNFTTIQAAVDAASPGDTVFVYAGVYRERVSVPKTLTLVGEDRNTTVIDGERIGDVLRVTADWVNVTGFAVRNSYSGTGDAAIEFDGVRHGRIFGNNVSDNWGIGIHLVGSAESAVEDNVLRSNVDPDGAGIFLSSSDDNRVVRNFVTDSADGVALTASHRNVVAGNNLSTNWDYGVSMGGSHENRIENNSLFDNWGRGVRASGSDRNVIRNNTLIQNYQGIELYFSENNTVTQNLLNNTWDYGIYLRYSGWNRVSGNTVVSTYADGVKVSRSSFETVDNNTFRGSLHADVDLDSSVGITVADNAMTRGILVSYSAFSGVDLSHWNTHDIAPSNLVNGRPVVYWKNATGGVVPAGAGQAILANATDVTVANETFDGVVVGVEMGFSTGLTVSNVTGRENVYGILLGASRDSVIEDVSFENASQMGIFLRLSDSNTVRNGTFAGARFNALRLESSFRNTVVSVNASGGIGASLYLQDSGENLLSGSTFAAYTGTGVYLRASSDNTLSGSTLTNNTRDGLYLAASHRNTIFENEIAGNGGTGANVTSSDANRVFHNNFAGNARQAIDDRANVWDDAYPSGGNYWSDYTGADEFRGPDQDIQGSDGIGDDLYAIDADSPDRYPLMGPFQTGSGRLPASPLVRAAVLAGGSLADVEVSWDVSGDDGGGEGDVAGYEVWVGNAYNPAGASYVRLASVPAGTTSYTHGGAGLGDAGTYFYQVRAIEGGSGRAAPSSVQAGKQARSLPIGWHLLSVPLVQADVSVAAVLSTIEHDVVRTYRAADPADPWKTHGSGRPGDLDALEWGDGLWVHVTAAGDLAVAGLVVEAPAFLLRPGWNLVAYASPIGEALGTSLGGTPGILLVEGYDPGSTDPYRLRAVDPAETLVFGGAYWILVAGAGGFWVQG